MKDRGQQTIVPILLLHSMTVVALLFPLRTPQNMKVRESGALGET